MTQEHGQEGAQKMGFWGGGDDDRARGSSCGGRTEAKGKMQLPRADEREQLCRQTVASAAYRALF